MEAGNSAGQGTFQTETRGGGELVLVNRPGGLVADAGETALPDIVRRAGKQPMIRNTTIH